MTFQLPSTSFGGERFTPWAPAAGCPLPCKGRHQPQRDTPSGAGWAGGVGPYAHPAKPPSAIPDAPMHGSTQFSCWWCCCCYAGAGNQAPLAVCTASRLLLHSAISLPTLPGPSQISRRRAPCAAASSSKRCSPPRTPPPAWAASSCRDAQVNILFLFFVLWTVMHDRAARGGNACRPACAPCCAGRFATGSGHGDL